MKVSLNWIRDFNDKYQAAAEPAPDGVDKLVEKIGAQLGAVEEVINLGKRYKGIVVVKVISAVKHPNADKLSLCMVDAGKGKPIQVVCGAPNVKADMLAAWIPPGNTVPSTYDKDPFVIEAREIRGQMSNGMLASLKELALGDDHTGILEIDEKAKIGIPFSEAYGLDDYIIDIENKMFTHRPDLFGQLGIARELAGIQGHSFRSPDWYKEDVSVPADGRNGTLKIEIKNTLPKLVPRFCALVIKDVQVGPSPMWLQVRLNAVGLRPINNIVDITNFFMIETAQPLHAYDYDKLKTGVLGARVSKKGEKLNLLNGKQIELNGQAVVITDGVRPIGLAGVMGGADTEVDETTKTIVLECASFDMNQTRKTAMAYGLFTDASTRFTKNQSPRQNRAVIAKAASDVLRIVGGRISGQLVDDNHTANNDVTVKVSTDFINQRLGTKLSSKAMSLLLANVEFEIQQSGDNLEITVPFWRTDIAIAEDIVEEVGRLHGYDKLPQQLPRRPIEPATKNLLLEFKDQVREILSDFGANEVLTYSFVPGNLLKKAGQDAGSAYKLSNALSPNLQYYRFGLLPSLLEKVHPNIKLGYDKFALFEIGKGHDRLHKDKTGLPLEFELLSLVYAASSKTNPTGAAYFQAKNYLDELATKLGIELEFTKVDESPKAAIAQPFQAGRTAMVSVANGGKYLGTIGELKAAVRQSLKLPEHTAGFEIDIQALAQSIPQVKTYQPLPRFPQTHQDFCLRAKAGLSYAELTSFVGQEMGKAESKAGYVSSIEPLDIYQRPSDKDHTQTTWRITLSHPERTLTTEEVNKLLDHIAGQARSKYKAERI